MYLFVQLYTSILYVPRTGVKGLSKSKLFLLWFMTHILMFSKICLNIMRQWMECFFGCVKKPLYLLFSWINFDLFEPCASVMSFFNLLVWLVKAKSVRKLLAHSYPYYHLSQGGSPNNPKWGCTCSKFPQPHLILC